MVKNSDAFSPFVLDELLHDEVFRTYVVVIVVVYKVRNACVGREPARGA